MGKMEDDAKALIDYARGGGPVGGPENKVTALKPKTEPTLRDDILEMLRGLTAEIESGRLSPSHLILGWGERTDIEGNPGTSFSWDAVGLNCFEVIGHLTAYATRLALGEGE